MRITLCGLVIVAFWLAALPTVAVEYKWTLVKKQAVFAPRDGAGALTFNNRMWLLGGWNPGDAVHFPKIANSEVWKSADGANWTLVTRQAAWEVRSCKADQLHAVVWVFFAAILIDSRGGRPLPGGLVLASIPQYRFFAAWPLGLVYSQRHRLPVVGSLSCSFQERLHFLRKRP
ncbi:MAG: hypothetical protein WCB27_17030 [Thermoguttaceae bacterium]